MSTLTLVPPVQSVPAVTAARPSPRPRPSASPAEQAVASAAALVDPIGLDELMELAELQTRVDRKYFVPADVFRRMIAELAGELRVLDIDGKRTDVVARVDGRNHPNAGETVTLAAKPGHVHAFDIESGGRLNDKPVVSA